MDRPPPAAAAQASWQLDAMRRVALAVAGASGPRLFDALVAEAARALPASAAMVAVFADDRPTVLRVLAMHENGQARPGFEYPLAGSPCAQVVGHGYLYRAGGVCAEVDPRSPFALAGFDAYAAFPLNDDQGRPLGVLAALDREPIAHGDAEHAEAVLKVVAVRAAAEIERTRALEALRRSEASYRTIFDSAESAIYVHDWDSFALIDANPRACEDHGRTRAELLSADPSDLMGGDLPYDLPHAIEKLQLARFGRCPPFEWQVRLKDGRLRWWEIHLKPAQLDGRRCILAFTHDITERKATEERLRASEEQYRAIFDASADALMLWDSQLRRVDANPANERLFGFAREESLGGGLENLPYPDDYVRPRVQMLRRALAGEASRAELEAIRRDGSHILVEMRTIPFEHRGEPHALQIARDITERQRAEQQLRASEEQHRTIFNASVDGMLVKDATNLVVDVNDAYLRMHGFAREQLIGRCLLDFLPPELQAHCGQVLPAVLAGRPCHFEATTWRRDRSPLDVEIHGVPVVYGGQTRALVIMRDITGRKAAEERLRRSEAQYRAIFDASADALMLWNSQLVRVDVNSAHERIFGFAREAVVGHAFEGLPYPDELARPRLEMVRRALAGEASRAELEAVRHDGTRILTELRTMPFVHRGEPHALQIARDITERKAAEERLRNSEQQYRAIFDGSADSMGLWNEDLVLVDVNHAFTRLAGWTRDDVIGRRLDERPGEPEIAQRIELIRGALAGREGRIEATVPSKDGPAYEVEIRYVPVSFGGRAYALSVARDITERNAALGALRAQEEQYRGIFNASADALVLRDADFRIVDVNSTYERMSGWTRDEVLGVDRVIANPADVAPAIRALHARALGGEPIEIEVPLVRRDGQRYELDLRGVPIRHRGQPHVLYMGRDVTERKRAEASLRAQEERYRAIFDGSVDPMVLWNERLEVTDVNRAFEEVTGFAREQMIGRHWTERGDAADMERLLPLVRAALGGQTSHTIDRVTHADGHGFDMEIRYLPVRLGGAPHALGVGRDVTERLQREGELARSEARLRASEEQYRAIFNASIDALSLWDSRMRRVDINAAYELLYGWTRDDVLGKGYEQLPFDADYYGPRQALVQRALAGEVGRAELESIRKDGRRLTTEIHAVPFSHRGEPHVLVIGRDLSERRAAEAERARLEDQLRQAQKMEAIGQLTGGIAHDFNNILTSVLGYIVLAQERALTHGDERLLRQLGQAQQAGERARDLVAQMLAFARRKSGRREVLAPEPLMMETVELLRPTLPSSVLLGVEAAAGALPPVSADPVQLGQVLMNLLINARDAVAGSGRVRVGLRETGGGWRCAACAAAVADGRWVELQVGDDGCGIAPEALHRIFDPFFTTKPAGQGTGMGLAMVHGIVHDHGGHVVVDSGIGAGTTFRVMLPVATSVALTSSGAAPRSRPVASPELAGSALVVEDDAQVGAYLAEQLGAWGLDVVLHADPLAAWRWLESDPGAVQLVLTDLTMPHLSGLDLAQRVHRLRPTLPVLLVSADLAAADAQALLASGVHATLSKPIEPAALRRAVADALAVLR
jgi:PAS domain S-box-containing protein